MESETSLSAASPPKFLLRRSTSSSLALCIINGGVFMSGFIAVSTQFEFSRGGWPQPGWAEQHDQDQREAEQQHPQAGRVEVDFAENGLLEIADIAQRFGQDGEQDCAENHAANMAHS